MAIRAPRLLDQEQECPITGIARSPDARSDGRLVDAIRFRMLACANGDLTGVLPVPVVNDFMVERGGVRVLWPMARRLGIGELRFAASPEHRLSRSNRRGAGQRDVNARPKSEVDSQRTAHGGKPPKNMGC
jgi:hypothetical protein